VSRAKGGMVKQPTQLLTLGITTVTLGELDRVELGVICATTRSTLGRERNSGQGMACCKCHSTSDVGNYNAPRSTG